MNNIKYSSYVTQELAGICFKNKTGYVAFITNNSESSKTIKILQKLYKHFQIGEVFGSYSAACRSHLSIQ